MLLRELTPLGSFLRARARVDYVYFILFTEHFESVSLHGYRRGLKSPLFAVGPLECERNQCKFSESQENADFNFLRASTWHGPGGKTGVSRTDSPLGAIIWSADGTANKCIGPDLFCCHWRRRRLICSPQRVSIGSGVG